MLKKILLAALTFSAITLSSAVGPGDGSNNNNDDEDPIVGEMFEELKNVGNDFRDLACSTCDQLINLAELPMNTFVSIEASRGIDIESEIFQARRIVFSRLRFYSQFEYNWGRIPEADHKAISTRIMRGMWDESIRRQLASPNESLLFNVEGATLEKCIQALTRYLEYLDEGGMEELSC